MTNYEALEKSYKELSPFSLGQRWEFDNNMVHLEFIAKHISSDKTIYDAGCGIGILILALKYLGYNVAGGDRFVFEDQTNASFVNDQKKLQTIWDEQDLKIVYEDITKANTHMHDVVLSVATIEHQPYPRLFMEGLISKLKLGGYLYVATPNVTNFLNRFRFLFGRAPMSNITEFYERGEKMNGHWREYTLDELKTIFLLSGLEVLVAKNVQSEKPHWKRWKKTHRNIFRVVAKLIFGGGDTNLILGKK